MKSFHRTTINEIYSLVHTHQWDNENEKEEMCLAMATINGLIQKILQRRELQLAQRDQKKVIQAKAKIEKEKREPKPHFSLD